MARAKVTMEAKEQRFAALIAQGVSYADAYRETHPNSKAKDESLRVEASKFASRPNVTLMVRELLRSSRLSDLTSIGEWHEKLMDAIKRAKDDDAHSAEMTGLRQLGQATGALQNTVMLDATGLLDDTAIIARLAGDDPRKAAMLRAIIGAEEFEQEAPKH